jgi:HK97 family phage portal protein
MGNGARPSGYLTTEQRLSDDAAKRLKKNWLDLHSGLGNTGGTAVLEQGLKWEALTLTMADLEFLEARKFQVLEICRMWRVPPHMIASMEGATHSNISQQAQDYRNNTLTSHTDIWEKRLDYQFKLREQDLFVDFNESLLLKADIVARYNVYRIGKLSGIDTTNEIRMAEGKDPVEGGDELMEPTNMAPHGSDVNGTAPDGAGNPPDDVSAQQSSGSGTPAL